MRSDKESAVSLRSQGKSYKEIYETLKIPKATLSDWFSKESWSVDIRKRLTDSAQIISTIRLKELDRVRGERLRAVYQQARKEAAEEFEQLKYNPLFIAGITLYWGEGDKRTKYSVKFVNTDGDMIRLFVIFLTHVCQIPEEKIRGRILLYPDLNDVFCKKYWSDQSGLSLGAFGKSIIIAGRQKSRKLSYGVCSIYVSSTFFKAIILEWLKLLPQELMNKDYYANM